jgi:hypothetical protein
MNEENLADLRAHLIDLRGQLVAQLVVPTDIRFLDLLASVHGALAAIAEMSMPPTNN